MSEQPPHTEPQLSGQRQKELRAWLGLSLPQFADMTTESTATHSRREQQNLRLAGPTEALVLVLDSLYGLREGPEGAQVETVRQFLATDPTRRHFIGRFGAAALLRMMQEVGLSTDALVARVQQWCQRDFQQTLERATAAQVQRTTGLRDLAFGAAVGAMLAGLSWAWLAFFSAPVPEEKGKKSERTAPTSTTKATGETVRALERRPG